MKEKKTPEIAELAGEVTEIIHRVATRRLVQIIEHIHETEIKPLRAALDAILADPSGCVFCDSGNLRNPDKDHDPKCGFALAKQCRA